MDPRLLALVRLLSLTFEFSMRMRGVILTDLSQVSQCFSLPPYASNASLVQK